MHNFIPLSWKFCWCSLLTGSTVLNAGLAGLSPAFGFKAFPDEPPHRQLMLAQASRPDFSDVGRPRRRQGGGSRGTCLIADRPPLTALVPESSTGFTLAQSPSFWFYLPYSLDDRHQLEFVLKDEQNNPVYTQIIDGQETTPGILNLRLPATVALEANKTYEWYLLVYCDAASQERFVFVNGAIRRLDRPDLQQQLATLATSAQTDLYRAEDLWYDALDSMAIQLRSTTENDLLRQQWTDLLQSIGLTHLATEPLVTCCGTDP